MEAQFLHDMEKAIDLSNELGLLSYFTWETTTSYTKRFHAADYGTVPVPRKLLEKYFGDIETSTFWYPMERTYWVTDMTLEHLASDPKLIKSLIYPFRRFE